MSNDFYKVGDKVIVKDYHIGYSHIKGKVYEVIADPEGEVPTVIIDEDDDYRSALKSSYDIYQEVSVTRSESFVVSVQGNTLTLTREEANELLDKLSGTLKVEPVDKSVPVAEVKIKKPLGVNVGDRYPELPAEIVEFRNEFGDFLQKDMLLAEYVKNYDKEYVVVKIKPHSYIHSAFRWSNSDKGDDFWDKVDIRWRYKLRELYNG